jgi:hypothetical protein
MAISLFYAFGTGLAALAPTLSGALIESASGTNVNYGYLIGLAHARRRDRRILPWGSS